MKSELSITSKLGAIQTICRSCDRRAGCEFGKPAGDVIANPGHSDEELVGSANSVALIWVKRQEKVEPKCPNPNQIDQIVQNLIKTTNHG